MIILQETQYYKKKSNTLICTEVEIWRNMFDDMYMFNHNECKFFLFLDE